MKEQQTYIHGLEQRSELLFLLLVGDFLRFKLGYLSAHIVSVRGRRLACWMKINGGAYASSIPSRTRSCTFLRPLLYSAFFWLWNAAVRADAFFC